MDNKSRQYILPIGPIHPAFKEPVMFEFEIEGEKILDVDVRLGFNHRGIEWMGLHRNPIQIIYLAERVCGICSFCHPFAFCRAIENLANIEVPERAEYIRVIIAEIERIHSHILWAGVLAHEMGFDSLLYLSWKIREKVMDITELLTGNRITKGILMIGGVRRNINEKQIKKIEEMIRYYRKNLKILKDVFLYDPTVLARTKGVGILSKEDALKLCAVGPTARASGVSKDVRQDQAYAAYADLDFKAVTPEKFTGKITGDVFDRIVVRLFELEQSLDIIEECIEKIPNGKILSEEKIPLLMQKLKVSGEGLGRHEAPRGEVIHYVKMTGKEEPYTWKIRPPTYNNISSWKPMLIGEQIADIPIVAVSIDPCISCTDRVAVVRNGKRKILTKEFLHELSIKKTKKIKRENGN